MFRDTRVAGKLEGDYGNLGMYGLRPQQMASVLLETLNAPDRIGEFHSARSPRAPDSARFGDPRADGGGGCSRTTSVHQSVQIDLFFDLTGELEVDDNNQVTSASIGLADAGSDLPPMPCLRRYAGNEKCGR